MKKVITALCIVVSLGARLSAELRYAMHMEIQKSDASAQDVHPMLAMMGEMMSKQLLPAGGADLVYIIGEKGTRIEYLQAALGQPAGAINLAQPDGTMVVLNPKEQTYWKTTAQNATAALKSAGIAPQATAKPTGEAATVAGVRCEVVAFEWKMALPIPENARASMPPDFPTSIAMAGDTCVVKGQFQKYAALAERNRTNDLMAAMGLDKLTQGGIVMRQKVRFAGIEMRSAVTEIGEIDAPPAAFEIPAGYKEVASPSGVR